MRALARDADPVATVVDRARDAVFEALEVGWSGPPFDPFMLADLRNVPVVANADVPDARLVPLPGKRLRIEFNPDRPRARVRYSIAHELAHTLFPDCAEHTRNRKAHGLRAPDEWQLETLCNLAAAELLMPVGTPAFQDVDLDIDGLLRLRDEYDVSAEAVLLRVVKLTDEAGVAFAATRTSDDRYRIEYAVPSQGTDMDIPRGLIIGSDSVPAQCKAIGFTAKDADMWEGVGRVHVECVGIPPTPGEHFPRVVGFAKPLGARRRKRPHVVLLHGDALAPRGSGQRIIAQIVNDKAATWGGGFALAVRKKWPGVQDEFKAWAHTDGHLSLGRSHLVRVDAQVAVFNMVAQHGYGDAPHPRIRYHALRACLAALGATATDLGASVHMPLIGAGQARGDWNVIRDLIEEEVCGAGVEVTVYALPGRRLEPSPQQPTLLALAP